MKGKFFAYPMSSQMPETVLVVGLAQKTIVSKSRQLEKMRRHKQGVTFHNRQRYKCLKSKEGESNPFGLGKASKAVALIWAFKDEEMGKYLLCREEKKREELLVDVSDNNDAHL